MAFFKPTRGAIHQLLSIILKLRILVLLPVSTLPYVVVVYNYYYHDGGSQLPQQILWNKFHIRCAYFTPNCTWSPNYSVLV
jgi:hypothetical protein